MLSPSWTGSLWLLWKAWRVQKDNFHTWRRRGGKGQLYCHQATLQVCLLWDRYRPCFFLTFLSQGSIWYHRWSLWLTPTLFRLLSLISYVVHLGWRCFRINSSSISIFDPASIMEQLIEVLLWWRCFLIKCSSIFIFNFTLLMERSFFESSFDPTLSFHWIPTSLRFNGVGIFMQKLFFFSPSFFFVCAGIITSDWCTPRIWGWSACAIFELMPQYHILCLCFWFRIFNLEFWLKGINNEHSIDFIACHRDRRPLYQVPQ